MHPLTSGQSIATLFTTRFSLPDYPGGTCPATVADFKAWIETLQGSVAANAALFGYTAGTMEAARSEDRDRPRFMFDDVGRFLGLALWMPDLQGWTIGGQIGQYMTLRRVKDKLTDDLASRPLAGWALCDGTSASLPNLSQPVVLETKNLATPPVVNGSVSVPSTFFTGSSPNWDTYTIGYVGA